MSVTPRINALWSSSSAPNMGYFDRGDESAGLVAGTAGLEGDGGHAHDPRTPLDKTIDRIGMGSYQWTLLSLCGFGWLADNMWLQAVAINLPRVQRQFDVPDKYIGLLSTSMFGGMMLGAVGWGSCSDLMGRTTAFNATLFLTAVFGVLASIASGYTSLCIALFFLGSAVGGSMPTDGTLLLEHMPNGKQHLVTALSVFFSVGSVLAAVVGLIVLPSRSCPPLPAPCDVATENTGWKYLFICLGALTLIMFLARIAFFRLHESPRYLVHAGRHQEAIESLQLISKFNGSELAIGLEDVRDHHDHAQDTEEEAGTRGRRAGVTVFDAQSDRSSQESSSSRTLRGQASREGLRSGESSPPGYNAIGETRVSLDAHMSQTPSLPGASVGAGAQVAMGDDELDKFVPLSRSRSGSMSPVSHVHVDVQRLLRQRELETASASASLAEMKAKVYWKIPRWIRHPMTAWADRVAMVLAPEWLRTTLIVWIVWTLMALAYTMFNVYLPKLLEGRGSSPDGGARSLEDSLWDVVIYTIGGCPGAIVGAWLVDSRAGRRWSLAGSTFVTGFFCATFVLADRAWAVTASTVGLSLSVTTMWAVLYGWTPEIFGTRVRGTACGIASALSRIGGMVAPLLGGSLLVIDNAFPVYASMGIFLVAGVCVLLLRENAGARGATRVLLH